MRNYTEEVKGKFLEKPSIKQKDKGDKPKVKKTKMQLKDGKS